MMFATICSKRLSCSALDFYGPDDGKMVVEKKRKIKSSFKLYDMGSHCFVQKSPEMPVLKLFPLYFDPLTNTIVIWQPKEFL